MREKRKRISNLQNTIQPRHLSPRPTAARRRSAGASERQQRRTVFRLLHVRLFVRHLVARLLRRRLLRLDTSQSSPCDVAAHDGRTCGCTADATESTAPLTESPACSVIVFESSGCGTVSARRRRRRRRVGLALRADEALSVNDSRALSDMMPRLPLLSLLLYLLRPR